MALAPRRLSTHLKRTLPVGTPLPAGEPGSISQGETAGVRYLEHMTGGAQPDPSQSLPVAAGDE